MGYEFSKPKAEKVTEQLVSVEEAKKKDGEGYLKFRTANGEDWSCFKVDVMEQLTDHMNDILDMSITRKGRYVNIVSLDRVHESPMINATPQKIGKPLPIHSPTLTKIVPENACMEVTESASSEPKVKLAIRQSVKGSHNWEVSVKGTNKIDVGNLLNDIVLLAEAKCKSLNASDNPWMGSTNVETKEMPEDIAKRLKEDTQ